MNEINLIFHIGMGKTGTTSIQWALENNRAALAEQGTHYLGMWFDMIEADFEGLGGTVKFLLAPPGNKAGYAGAFLNHVREISAATGATTFILSNEGLFERPGGIIPFLRALEMDSDVNVKAYAYLRNPAEWLKSAYAQWGLKHKTVEGPIRPFSTMAPNLLKQYACAAVYHEKIASIINFRYFDAKSDVVQDFSKEIGIFLPTQSIRKLARDEPAELILRREFNNLFLSPVLPSQFDKAIWGDAQPGMVQAIEEIVSSFEDRDSITDIIESQIDIFKYIQEEMHIPLSLEVKESSLTDKRQVRDRALDYLVQIVMRQSWRITRLEEVLFNSGNGS
ncbi:hypothetical protein LL251_20685 [Sphingobium naphthae]|nr:hypothetical protein [Sphingobium naphthae]